jgi:serine/tyrosine/threonine adenylyltransferase
MQYKKLGMKFNYSVCNFASTWYMLPHFRTFRFRQFATQMSHNTIHGEELVKILKTPKSVQELPVDTSMDNFPRRVEHAVYATVPVQPFLQPRRLVGVSPSALRLLHADACDPDQLAKDDLFVSYFSGSSRSMPLYSHLYWGTQFGAYAGQLGDGTAALVGESSGYEINLKGTGKTPFSRGFDGRKVLRSSVREFLCSEAMAGLGIPTTRAGTLIVSDHDTVDRDVNYSGRPIQEKCAVVSRIARSFIRFGSFESHQESGSPTIKQLAQYVSTHLLDSSDSSTLPIIIKSTARLIAAWQCIGFTHGVMNTDNMSIIGDTIDYGPFGFMESYDPYFVPNTSDKFGRYMFTRQPKVGIWNLKKLWESLVFHGVITGDDWPELERMYWDEFNRSYNATMGKKLGLDPIGDCHDRIFELLQETCVDYTVTFRSLCDLDENNVDSIVERIMRTFPPFEKIKYLSSIGQRVTREDMPEILAFAETRMEELERAGIEKETVQKWKSNFERIDRFERDEFRGEAERKWKLFLSELAPRLTDNSRKIMKANNPIYIPRQALIQRAIEKLENDDDTTEINTLLRLFLNPFVEDHSVDNHRYAFPDLTDLGTCLSCSS